MEQETSLQEVLQLLEEEVVFLVHFSEDPDFQPTNKAPRGFEERGCFFYLDLGPEANDYLRTIWGNRYISYWQAPKDAVEVLEEFDAGEFGSPCPVIELFVRAQNLKYVQRRY
jgi:hypothetical protein